MKFITKNLINKDDILGSVLKIGVVVSLAVLIAYWSVQQFGTKIVADPVNTFQEYPRTPDPVEACPKHGEYAYLVMVLRSQGITKEELLKRERVRLESFSFDNSDTKSLFWGFTVYMVEEAYKASDEVMSSKESMSQYAIRYFEECVRIKTEEAEI